MFEGLTDAQVSALHDVLSEEASRSYHHPEEKPQEHWDACSEMYGAVSDEAKKRRLW